MKSLATATLILLTTFVALLVTENSHASIRFNKSSLAENSMAKTALQNTNRKRSSRRRATSSKSNNTSAPTPPKATGPVKPATATRQGPLSQLTYELPIRKPLAGEEQVRGLLERVDCDARGETFIVKVGEQVFKLRTTSFNAVQFKTYTPDVSGEMTCGLRNPASNVVITFRPSKDARARFGGTIVTVEFVPKDFELKKE